MKRNKLHRPNTHVKPASYQPPKDELEKEFDSFPISPSNLAKCLRGNVMFEKEKKRKAATP